MITKVVMKNSTIFRVIVLGAFAIIGIIGMQAYWVVSTWNINEEEFEHALTQTIRKAGPF